MLRRDFLKSGANLAALSAIAPRSWAQAHQRPYNVVVFQYFGGWDVTLASDPLTHEKWNTTQSDIFIEYTQDAITKYGDMLLGPAMAPMAPFLNRFSTINGIYMSEQDIPHPAALYYASSGSGNGTIPVLPLQVADAAARSYIDLESSPFGVLNLDAMAPLLSSKATILTLSKLFDLKSLHVSPPSAFDTQALKLIKQSLWEKKNLITQFQTLLLQQPPENQNKNEFLMACAFASGVSRQAIIRFQENLDTHSSHEKTHLTNLTKAFANTAGYLKVLSETPSTDGRSVLDDAYILIVSDFARTPGLNSAKGKDHNPHTNSAFIAGPNIKPGQQFGQSRVKKRSGRTFHEADLIDFATGTPITKASMINDKTHVIYPETVIATLAQAMGLFDKNPYDYFDKKKVIPIARLLN